MARRTLGKDVVDGILNGLKNGLKPVDLAKTYGVSIPTVYNFKNRAAAVKVEVETVSEVESTGR